MGCFYGDLKKSSNEAPAGKSLSITKSLRFRKVQKSPAKKLGKKIQPLIRKRHQWHWSRSCGCRGDISQHTTIDCRQSRPRIRMDSSWKKVSISIHFWNELFQIYNLKPNGFLTKPLWVHPCEFSEFPPCQSLPSHAKQLPPQNCLIQ